VREELNNRDRYGYYIYDNDTDRSRLASDQSKSLQNLIINM